MATEAAPERLPRRGPAPIASFDHDVSDEVRQPSSPEAKQQPRLPEIREDVGGCAGPAALHAGETRARSHSTPAGGCLPAPRIDISRASSSSHQDSRDSSPELALFAGATGEESRARLELGFREDGALDLRSSTEELAFLEDAPSSPRPPPPAPPHAARRHSRKDSQSSEVALLAVSGRTSRLSSVGSQCSAHSALSGLSHVSHLSVASGVSRSPSPHRMLLETSFCGPRPIETDPEICAAAVEERLLEIAKLSALPDSRDRREVRAEVIVEIPRQPPVPPAPSPAPPAPSPVPRAQIATAAPEPAVISAEDDKRKKENANKVRAGDRRTRPRLQRELSEPEVYKSRNRTKDIIRIKLKPDEDYEEEKEEIEVVQPELSRTMTSNDILLQEPETRIQRAVRPTELVGRPPPSPVSVRQATTRESRTPSPAGPPVSRKSSFCSLFKSRETIGSPDSPSETLRRKRSLTEGGGRSKSRDRSSTPTSASKIRGSVLSLFRTPRRSIASPSPSTREGSPVVHLHRPSPSPIPPGQVAVRLKYYEDTGDGIIHIPLRTPPEERAVTRHDSDCEVGALSATSPRESARPASAPVIRTVLEHEGAVRPYTQPPHRTVLPDGSIIIPLHSPTERVAPVDNLVSTHREPEPTSDMVDIVPPVVTPIRNRVAADGAETSPAREQTDSNVPADPINEHIRQKKMDKTVFTTHVGSREQVFTTQFSITKTPSIASEISGSFPSFGDGEDDNGELRQEPSGGEPSQEGGTAPRDSSESEPSSEAGAPRAGSEVERRGLVIQDSFEEELPYVPTTLPLERSVALPMVPVRERGGVRVAPLQRPRAAPPPAIRPRAPSPPQPTPPADKLRIRLPRRPRSSTTRPRTRSGGDGNFSSLFSTVSNISDSDSAKQPSDNIERGTHDPGAESKPKQWIDFEDVPERRKQPKRIQTLPGGAAGAGSAGSAGSATLAGVVFSYVEPEQCRCECHGHARAPDLLSSVTPLDEALVELDVQSTRPFTSDLEFSSAPPFNASRSHERSGQ